MSPHVSMDIYVKNSVQLSTQKFIPMKNMMTRTLIKLHTNGAAERINSRNESVGHDLQDKSESW